MAWRFSSLFLAAIVAVGLSSGNLSSAEKEKKEDGEDSSGLERMKRSILWKQETFFSDEKLKDSASSEKAVKRRCKRASGGCPRSFFKHFSKPKLSVPSVFRPKKKVCAGIPQPKIYTTLRGHTDGCDSALKDCLVFDLGENTGPRTVFWKPHRDDPPKNSHASPFTAVLKYASLREQLKAGAMHSTLAEKGFRYAPYFNARHLRDQQNIFNRNRYLILDIPKDLKLKGHVSLKLKITEKRPHSTDVCEMENIFPAFLEESRQSKLPLSLF